MNFSFPGLLKLHMDPKEGLSKSRLSDKNLDTGSLGREKKIGNTNDTGKIEIVK